MIEYGIHFMQQTRVVSQEGQDRSGIEEPQEWHLTESFFSHQRKALNGLQIACALVTVLLNLIQ